MAVAQLNQKWLEDVLEIAASSKVFGPVFQTHAILSYMIQSQGPVKTLDHIPEVSRHINVDEEALYKTLLLDMTCHQKEFFAKHTVEICTGPACQLKGCQSFNASVMKWLDIQPGQATVDGHFYLKARSCMQICGQAPLLKVDQNLHHNLRHPNIASILQGYMEGGTQTSKGKTVHQPYKYSEHVLEDDNV